MSAPQSSGDGRPARVSLRQPRASDEAAFLAAVRRSRTLHRPWVHPPSTPTAFRDYIGRGLSERSALFFAFDAETNELVGVVNVSEIVRGAFQSAYLGYYSFLPYAGRGYMTEALTLVIARAFGPMRLHRLEANVQPGNAASIALVRRLGFTKEGFSKRYLKIGGRWRDHERWAILAEDWKRR